ncbi:MAG: chemotaxis protein CheW [bacterium]|jgi:purine-binding chemotaxis protein CheW
MEEVKEMDRAERQIVVFNLAGEAYGVDITAVQEIIHLRKITHVPRMPPEVNGVINLRGKIVPVVDLRRRLSLPCRPLGEESRIIVVRADDCTLGLIVDGVHEVLRIDLSLIEPISAFVVNVDTDYLTGVVNSEERLIVLIDLDLIFPSGRQSGKAAI